MPSNMIRTLFGLLLFVSCVNHVKDSTVNDTLVYEKNNDDSALHHSSNLNVDTTIIYDFEGISTEGAEAKAHYHNKNIANATMNVYGEMGKIEYEFIFENDSVQVKQWIYKYAKPITAPDFEEGKLADSTVCTLLAKNGHFVRGKSNSALNATYETLLQKVPLKL